jgi:RimJ/RimL family protein N-acetyltransferase
VGNRGYAVADEMVALRPFTLDDVPAVTTACQDQDIARWTTIPSPYDESHASSWIGQHERLRSEREAFPFAIVDAETGRFLGSISVQRPEGDPPSGEVGYWVASPERRRGVATRALRLISEWAFRDLGLASLHLHTMIGNVASERVADKAGYELVGEVTDYRPLNAPDQDVHVRRWEKSSPVASRTP